MTDQTAPTASPSPEPAAPAPMLESEARTWAMLVHIIAAVASFISAGTVAFVAPLVIWLIYRERSALVDHHGKQNLNLQLTTLIVMIGGVIIGLATLFIGFIVTGPIMLGYWVYSLIVSIIAGIKAQSGEYYRIPLVIPFVK